MKSVFLTHELARVLEDAGLGEVRSGLATPLGGRRGRVSGLMGPARTLVEAVLAAPQKGPVLLVVSHERRVAEVSSDVAAFFASMRIDREIFPFPALEVDPYRGLSPHFDITAARARALAALLQKSPALFIAPAAALLFRTASPEEESRFVRATNTAP